MVEGLRHWASKARKFEASEHDVRESLPPHCREVLANKRVSLFQAMSEGAGYKDATIVADMGAGFNLSGKVNLCPVFKKRRSSASISVSELERSAKLIRTGSIRSTQSSGDAALDKAIFEATKLELGRGPRWQGATCRPIDNLLESGLNATTYAEDAIVIHS